MTPTAAAALDVSPRGPAADGARQPLGQPLVGRLLVGRPAPRTVRGMPAFEFIAFAAAVSPGGG